MATRDDVGLVVVATGGVVSLRPVLARDPARLALRAAAGDGEGGARQAGLRPVHVDPDPVLRPRVLRRGTLARVRRRPLRRLSRAARRDGRRRSSGSSPPGRPGRIPRAGCSAGRPCPPTSTPPTCWPRRCARTSPSSRARPPTSTGAAARTMRLNFSASRPGGDPRGNQADRRRGRRAGRALRIDHASTHRTFRRAQATGDRRSPDASLPRRAAASAPPPGAAGSGGDVIPLRRRER